MDWNSTVYLNGARVGSHIGGFDGFTIDLSASGSLKPTSNELIVAVYDPSDEGYQPNGKQRISAISNPGGDTYLPSSGIWQTPWLEGVPAGYYISGLRVRGDAANLYITVDTVPPTAGLAFVNVSFGGVYVTSAQGDTLTEFVVPIPPPQRLWSAAAPNLYDAVVEFRTPGKEGLGYTPVDSVQTYFGMREVGSTTAGNTTRPSINGAPVFFAGVLDQSYWPDGEYAAPSDAALAFDLQSVLDFGLNAVRLHQKVNPERWYYHADKLGIYVLQDMVQKYGGASGDTCNPFMQDLKAMMDGRGSHPSIVREFLMLFLHERAAPACARAHERTHSHQGPFVTSFFFNMPNRVGAVQ